MRELPGPDGGSVVESVAQHRTLSADILQASVSISLVKKG